MKNRKTAAKNCKNRKPPKYNRPPFRCNGQFDLSVLVATNFEVKSLDELLGQKIDLEGVGGKKIPY